MTGQFHALAVVVAVVFYGVVVVVVVGYLSSSSSCCCLFLMLLFVVTVAVTVAGALVLLMMLFYSHVLRLSGDWDSSWATFVPRSSGKYRNFCFDIFPYIFSMPYEYTET